MRGQQRWGNSVWSLHVLLPMFTCAFSLWASCLHPAPTGNPPINNHDQDTGSRSGVADRCALLLIDALNAEDQFPYWDG